MLYFSNDPMRKINQKINMEHLNQLLPDLKSSCKTSIKNVKFLDHYINRSMSSE